MGSRKTGNLVPSIGGLVMALGIWTIPVQLLAQSPCDDVVSAFNDAAARGDLRTIVAAARGVLDGGACPAETRSDVSRKTALFYVREAIRISDGPEAPAARLKLLETGSSYAQPWQLMAMLGDIRQKLPGPNGKIDRGAASLAYQAALADINDSRSVPRPPPAAEIERITHLAQETRMAAPNFVRGELLMSREIRDVAVESNPVPVQFVRDKDEMTTLGRQYADETFGLLNNQGKPRIGLIGHTDPDGSDLYNDDLSLRRAQALKRYFVERGYPAGSIDVIGRGKRDPLRIVSDAGYSRDERYQMERRVEVKFR
jgi:outer membrane protein OmpA-like peptidoglycan-associated protein